MITSSHATRTEAIGLSSKRVWRKNRPFRNVVVAIHNGGAENGNKKYN